MSLDEGPPPPPVDWTAQRVFLGRPVYVWQLNLAALLAVLFVAFGGGPDAEWGAGGLESPGGVPV